MTTVAEAATNLLAALDAQFQQSLQHKAGDRFSEVLAESAQLMVVIRKQELRMALPASRKIAGYLMKGTEFPNAVFYPASHRPSDIDNFDVVYFE